MIRLYCLLTLFALACCGMATANDSDRVKTLGKLELLGGKVVRDQNSPDRPVRGIDFHDSTRLTEKHLHLLKGFTDLGWLDLGTIAITDDSLKELTQALPNTRIYYQSAAEAKAISQIEQLGGQVRRDPQLPGRPVISANLFWKRNQPGDKKFDDTHMSLLDSFPSLIHLSLSETAITDAGFKQFQGWKNLKSLRLDNTAITDDSVREISEIPNLQSLSLQNVPVTAKGLRELTKLKLLTSLDLFHCRQIRDAEMKVVGELGNLVSLDLQFTGITDIGLSELKRLKQLKYLFVGNTDITDAGLVDLGQLTQLTQLFVDHVQITDVGLKSLSQLTNLESLWIDHTQITDVGLMVLPGMKRLRSISLTGTATTKAGIAKLKATLPMLNVE